LVVIPRSEDSTRNDGLEFLDLVRNEGFEFSICFGTTNWLLDQGMTEFDFLFEMADPARYENEVNARSAVKTGKRVWEK